MAKSHAALVVTEPSGLRGQTFALTADEVKIGRAQENDLQLEDPYVSRHHAIVRRAEGTVTIEDAGSSSGVLVNGVRATEPSRLRSGDRIRLGDVELEFVGGEAESPSSQATFIRPAEAPPEPAPAAAPAPLPPPTAAPAPLPPPEPAPAATPAPLLPPTPAPRFELGNQQGGVISNVVGDQYNQQMMALAPMRARARWVMRFGFTLILLGFAGFVVGFAGFSQGILHAMQNPSPTESSPVNAGAWVTAAVGSLAASLGLIIVIISLFMKRNVRKLEERL